MGSGAVFIIDANVLIDFVRVRSELLGLVVEHVAPICVPLAIVREVEGLDEAECVRLDMTLMSPEVEEISGASAGRRGLSFEDHLCLVMAKGRRWTCVTNDKRLRRECGNEGVPVMWGLQLLLRLVASGALDAEEAVRLAQWIRDSNPFHLTTEILARFRLQLEELRARED